MSANENILEVEDLMKSFGPVEALRNISFELERNSILGLVGDNGAGKSTLLKILNGYHKADEGVVRFDGKSVQFNSPEQAATAGIAMTYEEFALDNTASVWENFFMGREKVKSYGPLKIIKKAEMRRDVKKALQDYGFTFSVDKNASDLSGGQRRILVVSRAIESEPKLLLLDEPFRGLSERAIDQVWEILKDYATEGTVIITSQWYDTLQGEVDDVMIFRLGEKVGKYADRDITQKEANRLLMEGDT